MNYHTSAALLEKVSSNCQTVLERCRNQSVTLMLQSEQLRGSALLRDHEPKLRQAHARQRQMDRVARRLLATIPE